MAKKSSPKKAPKGKSKTPAVEVPKVVPAPVDEKRVQCTVHRLPHGEGLNITGTKETLAVPYRIAETPAEKALMERLRDKPGSTALVTLAVSEMRLLASMVDREIARIAPAPKPTPKSVQTAPPAPKATPEVVQQEYSKQLRLTHGVAKHVTDMQDGPVLAATPKGKTLVERKVERANKVFKRLEGDMWKLTYDIPDRLGKECPNPSYWLWWYGFRDNLSCWVLPDGSLKSPRVQQELELWREYGVKVRLVRYHPDDVETIREMCREELATHVKEAHTSLLQRIDDSLKRVQKAEAAMQAHEEESGIKYDAEQWAYPTKHHLATVRGLLRHACGELEGAIRCAQLFDEYESVEELLQGLHKVLQAEVAQFNAVATMNQIKLAEQPPKLPM